MYQTRTWFLVLERCRIRHYITLYAQVRDKYASLMSLTRIFMHILDDLELPADLVDVVQHDGQELRGRACYADTFL